MTDFARTSSEHLSFAFQPMPLDERLIDGNILPGRIFDKKRNVWRQIKKLRKQFEID
jgi:hypothetical protein